MIKILSSLAEQKLGYSFGKPLRVDEKSLAVVLPILRETSINRQYITFPETEKVNVFDTGKIDQMEAHNTTDQNVFVRSGTLFKGSTQERALMRSAVLFPGKRQMLGVRCVHASRGINPGSKVGYGGLTPHDFDAANYSHGYSFGDQSTTWANVQKSTSNMSAKMGYMSSMGGGVHSSDDVSDAAFIGFVGSAFTKSDDLHSSFKEFATHFDSVLSKVKMVENQAGLALINQNGVETIEVFDHKDSWKALHEAAVKRLGSNIVGKDDESVFEYKPENAQKQVNRILGMDWKLNQIYRHRPSNGEPEVEITGLSGEGYVGEAVEVNGALIHLVLLRQSQC